MAKQAGAGADYEAAYTHALAGRLPDAEALCREILGGDLGQIPECRTI